MSAVFVRMVYVILWYSIYNVFKNAYIVVFMGMLMYVLDVNQMRIEPKSWQRCTSPLLIFPICPHLKPIQMYGN